MYIPEAFLRRFGYKKSNELASLQFENEHCRWSDSLYLLDTRFSRTMARWKLWVRGINQ